jgi:hypothetical protein
VGSKAIPGWRSGRRCGLHGAPQTVADHGLGPGVRGIWGGHPRLWQSWGSDIRAQKKRLRIDPLSAGARRRQSQYRVCGFPACDVIYIPFLSWSGTRHSPVRRIIRWCSGRGIGLVGFQSRFQHLRRGLRRPSRVRLASRQVVSGGSSGCPRAPSATILYPTAPAGISNPPLAPQSFGGIGGCAWIQIGSGSRPVPPCSASRRRTASRAGWPC